MRAWSFLLVLFFWVPRALAADAPQGAPATHYWYDGTTRRALWLDGDAVMEFAPDSRGESAMLRAYAKASVEPVSQKLHGVRLWRLNGSRDAASAMKALRVSYGAKRFSPVLRDAPEGRRVRALPGNVVVGLDAQWTEDEARRWLERRNLTVVRRLEFAPNTFLVSTGAGFEALEMANRLFESGEVKASYPDWWHEVHTR